MFSIIIKFRLLMRGEEHCFDFWLTINWLKWNIFVLTPKISSRSGDKLWSWNIWHKGYPFMFENTITKDQFKARILIIWFCVDPTAIYNQNHLCTLIMWFNLDCNACGMPCAFDPSHYMGLWLRFLILFLVYNMIILYYSIVKELQIAKLISFSVVT